MLTEENEELNFDMEVQFSEAQKNVMSIWREIDERNRLVQPLVVMKITIEILVNRKPPSAMYKNVKNIVRLVCPNSTKEELPNTFYVNKMIGTIKILTETLAVCKLGKNPEWSQSQWDRASRRTKSMTTFATEIRKKEIFD